MRGFAAPPHNAALTASSCRNLDLLLGLENRILYTAIDILEGECRLDQALIRDKRWKNLALLSMSRNRQRCVAATVGAGGPHHYEQQA